MVGWLDTLAHEETHLFNAYHAIAVGEHAAITLREDLIYHLPATDTPPRSVVWPELTAEQQNGIYAPTHLTDWQGTRGFNALLDETNAYLNEIGAVAGWGRTSPATASACATARPR